jgi:hypothetical protein
MGIRQKRSAKSNFATVYMREVGGSQALRIASTASGAIETSGSRSQLGTARLCPMLG